MAEAEYISKEAALACFGDWIDRYGHEHTADEMVEYQRIEELPEEDVRPVVHGTWLWYQASGHGIRTRTCSVCGQMRATDKVENFCPNCGADMREVGTE